MLSNSKMSIGLRQQDSISDDNEVAVATTIVLLLASTRHCAPLTLTQYILMWIGAISCSSMNSSGSKCTPYSSSSRSLLVGEQSYAYRITHRTQTVYRAKARQSSDKRRSRPPPHTFVLFHGVGVAFVLVVCAAVHHHHHVPLTKQVRIHLHRRRVVQRFLDIFSPCEPPPRFTDIRPQAVSEDDALDIDIGKVVRSGRHGGSEVVANSLFESGGGHAYYYLPPPLRTPPT